MTIKCAECDGEANVEITEAYKFELIEEAYCNNCGWWARRSVMREEQYDDASKKSAPVTKGDREAKRPIPEG